MPLLTRNQQRQNHDLLFFAETFDIEFDDAVGKVITALKGERFGVLTTIYC